jgi:putative acetyltransferase
MMQLRPACPEDQIAIMALIDAVYREYGDRLCLENADRDLLDIDTHYVKAGGAFVVLDDAGCVRGTHAVLPEAARARVGVFRRLYLEAALRGGPWGAQLMQWAIDWARAHNMSRIEFWSDTRFTRAHAFFARFGCQRDGRIRSMDDGCMPYQEYFFFLNL